MSPKRSKWKPPAVEPWAEERTVLREACREALNYLVLFPDDTTPTQGRWDAKELARLRTLLRAALRWKAGK